MIDAARTTPPPAAGPAPRVIGGLFGLATQHPARPLPGALSDPNFLALANARGGLRLVLRRLRPRCTWMPAYLCASMTRQPEAEGLAMRFYPLDEALASRDRAWLDEVQPGDIVVVVDYFGFVLHGELADACRERGALVVEDAAHALLSSEAGTIGDFVLFSPRKYAGLPDGGVLHAHAPLPAGPLLLPPGGEWFDLALAAGRGRARFDAEGGDRDWLALNDRAEALHPDEPTAMHPLTRELAGGLDWADIARRRVGNYRVLADALAPFALLPELPDGTVPHGFTVRLGNRDAVRAALFRQDIFPSLLWPLAGVVPTEFAASHRLSAQAMTLHCDQRYDIADMHRIADIVRREGRAP